MPRPGALLSAAAAPLVLLAAIWTGLFARPALAASPFVPMDHPAYAQVEAWVARGLLPPTILGMRPYTWERLGTMLAQARARRPEDRSAILALAREVNAHAGPGDRRHADITLSAARADGQPLTYVNVPATSGGPLGAYDAGLGFPETWGGEARLRSEGRWGTGFATDVMARVPLGVAEGGNPALQEGYAAFDAGPILVATGRQPFQWGPGHDGGFILTDNAAPLTAVRMGLKAPHTFRGWWSWLGTWDFSYLLARLEDKRVVPNPELTGLRLMWKPTRHLELGASRTILLGGEGRPSLSWSDYVTVLGGNNLSGGADTSDSIAGVDAAYTLPMGDGAVRIYGEYAGEDEAHQLHLPSKPAVRGGIYLAGLGPAAAYTARAEFAATDVFYNHERWGHNFWYSHSTYQTGYTYRGRILGDAMGSDARTARLWITRPGARTESELMLGWFATRFSDPDREDHWQVGLRRSRLAGPARVTVDLRLERVRYAGPRTGDWQSLVLFTFNRPVPDEEESSPP
jgi:hypothetical protein